MNTIENTTADTFQYTTADELRDLLDDSPTFPELEELLACIPVDLEAFHARMVGIVGAKDSTSPEENRQAVIASLMACAEPGHDVSAEFAELIDRAMLTSAKLMQEVAQRDRAAILADIAEAIRARDEKGLSVAIGMAPINIRKYAERIESHVTDSLDASPDEIRRGCIEAMKASATPGAQVDDELAEAVLNAMAHWHAIKTETPEQRAIREAFAEARRLIDLYGDEDPRAFSAIVNAIELQDPGICDRKLAECGIKLPTPTHCNADGEGLLTLEQVAAALGADPEDLMPRIEEMEAAGLNVRQRPAGTLH